MNLPDQSFTLRTHRAGDMGLITYRHGVIYCGPEFGFDQRFEALVARITADFIDDFDPKQESCWIAEKEGEFLGCVMLIRDKQHDNTAKLRLLLVEETARGMGVGTKLIQQCIDFSKEAGYTYINLWTQSILEGARRLYTRAGFKLVQTEEHESWGAKLTGEMWQLKI